MGVGVFGGQRQCGEHRRQGEPVVEATFGGQRMADLLRDSAVLQERIDERHLRRGHDRRQADRLP